MSSPCWLPAWIWNKNSTRAKGCPGPAADGRRYRDGPSVHRTKESKEEACVMTQVVAALIWAGNRFMICQRPANKARGLLWEFVGGKVEPGETREQALIRECREELGVTVSVGPVFQEVTHTYPDLTVHLTLFHASIAQGIPQALEHNDIRWIQVEEIPNYTFCPADVEILKALQTGQR